MTTGATSDHPTAHFVIRPEAPDDAGPIDEVTTAAFRDHPFSQHTEHRIVRGLREADALSLSLVATIEGRMVGHAAFSPVTIDAQASGWWGLGPVSVLPAHQRRGVGSALVRSGLRRLREQGVAGCVVLGDPAYYCRFGFAPRTGLVYPGPPAEHFMALATTDAWPVGEVGYLPVFSQPGP